MEDFTPNSPEQAKESVDTITGSPEDSEVITIPVERLQQRVGRLDKFKEGKKRGSGSPHDEDQQQALAAAKASKGSGRFMMVMGKEVDLNTKTEGFFRHGTHRVAAVVRRNAQKAVEWLASLREAYQAWERNGTKS